jgi:hypothetical protein
MAIQEFSSPFRYRRGGKPVAALRARGVLPKVEAERDTGNIDRPGLDLPICNDGEAHEAAKALDEICARRPMRPPGRR